MWAIQPRSRELLNRQATIHGNANPSGLSQLSHAGAEDSLGGAAQQFGEEAANLRTTTVGGVVRDQHGLVHVVRHDRLDTLAGCLKVLA